MSLRISIVALLFLAACGFQPVHGSKATSDQDSIIREGIKISATSAEVPRMAQLFTQHLEDLMPTPLAGQPPLYELHVTLTESTIAIGVARDGTAARYNLAMDSTYTINRAGETAVLANGSLRNVTSYNNPNNQYFSIYVSEEDARKRGLQELAELYRQRLISYTPTTLVPALPPANAPNIPVSPLLNEDRPKTY